MSRDPMKSSTAVPVFMWMTGALVAFVFAAISIRTLTSSLNVFEIGIVRTAGGLLLILGYAALRPSARPRLLGSSAAMHAPRNIIHAIGGILWTLAIAYLPLATVFSLEFTSPAWVALLSFPLLGERINKRAAIGILAGLLGVLIILRPSPGSFNTAALFPLAAAFCFGLNVLLTRRLALSEPLLAILFWMMTLQLAFFAAGALAYGGLRVFALPFSWTTTAAMIGLAVAGMCSQLCLSRALQIGEAGMVVPLDFLRVPLIAIVGWLLYDEQLNVWLFLGAAMILSGIAYGLIPSRPVAVVRRHQSAPAE
ncbi:DMT family transporter [uncultured Alsobacter sp.]|uniref:DMT family transporter n=1 Tax=uncultured Alsobacter sp. TaxID=1748258 RepID=UPI0025E8BB89|nr:DMT family transporter [uncultured Alsobacter sp.]